MRPRVPLLLFALLVVPLAGCSAAGSIGMTAVDDTELAEYGSRSLPSADRPEATERRELVREAVRNGSATANGTSPPVDAAGLPFAVDGAYYELSAETLGTHTHARVGLRIDYDGTTDGEAVAVEDLSAADRELVAAVLPPRSDRRTEGHDSGTGLRYTDAEVERSVLLREDYDAVVYGGERDPIRVDRRRGTVTEYRYTATAIAPNAAAYVDSIRSLCQFALSGLSGAEREVVDEAIDGGYYADSADGEAFAAVLGRFRSRDAVVAGGYAGAWVVRYRGTVHWADLRYDGFASAEGE